MSEQKCQETRNATKPRQSKISEAYSGLNEEIDVLDGCLRELEKWLTPILDKPNPSNDDCKSAECDNSLAGQLKWATSRIKARITHVQDIIERLEL